MIWEQSLDQLRSYIARLEKELAEVDAMVSCHASKLDPNPRDQWPKGSILEAAVGRHTVRCAEESLNRTIERARANRRFVRDAQS
jgi:hypothetical protein